jgi:hypothetical protein
MPFCYLDDLRVQRNDHDHNEADHKLNDAFRIHSLAPLGLMTVGISVGDLGWSQIAVAAESSPLHSMFPTSSAGDIYTPSAIERAWQSASNLSVRHCPDCIVMR